MGPSGFADHFVASATSCWFESVSVLVEFSTPGARRNNPARINTGKGQLPQRGDLNSPRLHPVQREKGRKS